MKLALAAAIVQEPELLILDEPTNAVDAIGVARLKERLRALRAGGTTILLATHMIDFAEGLCDDITVLLAGEVQYTGPVSGLGNGTTTLESKVLALIDADVA
jgi:ABC-2 type transport system ATP-binding protein